MKYTYKHIFKNMHIAISDPLQKFIQSKVNSGDYNNASEVIRSAIRRMKEEDNQKKYEQLAAELFIGFKQIEEGDVVEYTPELIEQLKKSAQENIKSKIPVKDSVKP